MKLDSTWLGIKLAVSVHMPISVERFKCHYIIYYGPVLCTANTTLLSGNNGFAPSSNIPSIPEIIIKQNKFLPLMREKILVPNKNLLNNKAAKCDEAHSLLVDTN